MTCILAISKVSRFWLASVAEQAGLNLTWSKIPEDTFLRDMADLIQYQKAELNSEKSTVTLVRNKFDI